VQAALQELFQNAGFICKDVHVHERTVENRRKQSVMHRRWLQGVFCLPPGPPDRLCLPLPLADAPVLVTRHREQTQACNQSCNASAGLHECVGCSNAIESFQRGDAACSAGARGNPACVGACSHVSECRTRHTGSVSATGKAGRSAGCAGAVARVIGQQERAWLPGTPQSSQLLETLDGAKLVCC
jgi:hypothetical protein